MPTKRTVVALAVTLIVAGTLSTTPAQAQDWKSYAGHHYTFILRKTGKTYRAAVWDQSLDSLTRCFKGRVGKPPPTTSSQGNRGGGTPVATARSTAAWPGSKYSTRATGR